MTNELEKTFFDTFGIGAYYKYLLIDKTSRCHNAKLFDKINFIDFIKSGKDYLLLKVIKYHPQITDRILLELICKLSGVCCPHFAFERGVEELKEAILKLCIYYKEPLKYQVRTLFEEEN